MAGSRPAERTITARVRESVVVSEPADHRAARTRQSATIRKVLRNGGQGPSKPLPSTVTLRGHAQTWAHRRALGRHDPRQPIRFGLGRRLPDRAAELTGRCRKFPAVDRRGGAGRAGLAGGSPSELVTILDIR